MMRRLLRPLGLHGKRCPAGLHRAWQTPQKTHHAKRHLESTEPVKQARNGRTHTTDLGTATQTCVRIRCDRMPLVWWNVTGHRRYHRPRNHRQNSLPHPPVARATGAGDWAHFLNGLSSTHKPQRIDTAQVFSASNSRMQDKRPPSIGEAPPFAYAYGHRIWPVSFPTNIE